MARGLVHRSDNKHLVFSETPPPQLTDVRVEGTYEVSPSETGEADEVGTFEFDPSTSPAQARGYVLTAANGALMGALSVLWQRNFNLADVRKSGTEKIEKTVIGAAQRVELKRENPSIADVIRFLEQIFPFAGDKLTGVFGGGLQHHPRDFSHHAPPVGFMYSTLIQFTGKGFGTTTDGSFAIFDLPVETLKNGRLFDRNVEEELPYGTLNWVLHPISDMTGSSSTPGAGTGTPGPILSFLKEASTLPFFRDMTITHEDKVATFSQWMSKTFNGTLLKDQDGSPLRFDLRTEVGLASQILTQVPAVLANECIVRGFYTIMRLIDELRYADVSSVKDLGRINPSRFLLLNSRALTRMLTVASDALAVINTSIAAVRAAVAGAASGEVGAAPLFSMRLSYVGIGRFAFALWADRSCIYEDVGRWWKRYQASKMGTNVIVHAPMGEEVQRVVESLRTLWLKDDCRREKNGKQRERKEVLIGAWVRRWRIVHDGSRGGYFLDAADAYRGSEAACAGEDRELVRLAIAQQLLAYRPYAAEKKLSPSQAWLTDAFTSGQDAVDSETLRRLKGACASYDRWLSDAYTKWVVRGTTVVVATAATSGVATVAAPAIATVLTDEAVVGLNGAALTSTSLAWVGGGSLAAKGLGMAGGTAIITGGGTVLGLTATSGGAALVEAFNRDYAERVRQGCIERLVQYSVLLEESPAQALRVIEDSEVRLERAIDTGKRTIDALKGVEEKDEEGLRQSLDEGVSHLRYTVDELGKLEQKARETAVKCSDLTPSGSTDIARVPELDQCDLPVIRGRTLVR